jgi:hypothetical protein
MTGIDQFKDGKVPGGLHAVVRVAEGGTAFKGRALALRVTV